MPFHRVSAMVSQIYVATLLPSITKTHDATNHPCCRAEQNIAAEKLSSGGIIKFLEWKRVNLSDRPRTEWSV